jgi:HEAT repeat protein
VKQLLEVAADPDPGFAIAAREAIAKLPGAAVDREIKDRLETADTASLPLLVGIVGDRRIGAGAELVPLVGHGDAAVRSAALKALGAVVDLPNLGVLIKQVVTPRGEAESTVAQAALKEACVRMPDRDACAEQLAAAVAAGQGDTRIILLDTIGDVGGARALAALRTAAMSKDPALEDAATRLLGKWMTADAAPVLLELAQPEAGGKFQTRALRGYIRIARQFVLPDGERAEMCRRALKVATDEVDHKAVLEILSRYPSAATLAVAEEVAAKPGREVEAKAAVTAIKAKLPPAGR